MRKGMRFLLIVLLSLTFGTGLIGEVGAALSLLDGDLVISGYILNETGIRLKDRVWHDSLYSSMGISVENAKQEQGDLSRCRTTLQLESEWSITSDFILKGILRGYYDAKYSINDSFTITNSASDLKALPRGERLQADIDLREYYFLYSLGDFTFKVGRQQVVWGESDGLRISDVVNAIDFSRDFTTGGWEDVRIPERLIDITYVVPESVHDFKIEAVVSPEDYHANTFAPYGDNFYGMPFDSSWIGTYDFLSGLGLPPALLAGVTEKSFGDALNDAISDALPDRHDFKDGFAGGVRLRGVFGPWDIHVYNYYQRMQTPVFTSSNNFSFILPFPWDVYDENLGIKVHYPHINTLGATFNVFSDYAKTIFRGECGYIFDEPFTALDPALGGFFANDYVEKDSFIYMLGFDRPTWITFLNPIKTFFISGQFIHKIVINYDDDSDMPLATVMGKKGSSDHRTMLTLLMNTTYWDDKIKPENLVVWDVNGHSGYVKPLIAYEPTYNWRFEAGLLYFWGDSYGAGVFGQVKDSDEVYVKIKFSY